MASLTAWKFLRAEGALFALTGEAVADRVAGEFSGSDAELISTKLTADQEARLCEAFGQEAG
jgi:uncharacterized membrane protein